MYRILAFIQAISIAPLQVHHHSEARQDTARSFTSKHHRQLRVKDLSKVPMWRLERDIPYLGLRFPSLLAI